MDNRFIITCGSPGSASAWIPLIISRIFAQNNVVLSNENKLYEILSNNINIKSGYRIGEIPIINPVQDQPEKISIQTTRSNPDVDKSKNTLEFKNIEISRQDLAENTSLIYSHASPGYFLGSKLDEISDVLFYTYRNLLDQAASMLRLFGLPKDQIENIKNGNLQDDISVTLHTNPKNFLVSTEDSMDSFYNKYFYLMQLREAGLGYLKFKEEAKCPIVAFDFESLTITKEKECIEEIGKAINLRVDAEKILSDLKPSRKPGESCLRNHSKKKVNIAQDYFSQEMQNRLKNFFGDIMSLYDKGYLQEYSKFLNSCDSINVLRVCPRYEQEKDNELKILSYLKNVENVTDIDSPESIEDFISNKDKNYTIFVFDKFTCNNTVSYLEKKKPENMEIYPLHYSLYGYPDYIYNLKTKEKTDILDIDTYGDKLLIVYEKNIPINLNFLLKDLESKEMDVGIFGNINDMVLETVKNLKNIKVYENLSQIPDNFYKSVLINSQEARFVYTLARRISKTEKFNNIYSFHPLFEFKQPTLKKIIENNMEKENC